MSINIQSWKKMTKAEQDRLLRRSGTDISDALAHVQTIIDEVKKTGDTALRAYTATYDGVDLAGLPLRVTDEEFEQACRELSEDIKKALDFAIENITTFHKNQKPKPLEMVQVQPGLFAGERITPIDSAGLYVPRGRGNFPSMLYMLAVPAVVAGVPRISIVTPPGERGAIDPACLYAAQQCGVTEVFRVGGAHAVAALAFGTESIAPAVKIVGPGSLYVTAAKRLLYGTVDVGLPAGPSESIILADGSPDPRTVALDLLIEAEHGSDSQALLITSSEKLARATASLLPSLLETLPEPRRTFASEVLTGYGGIITTDSIEEAAEIVNRFAPEHLQVRTEEPFDTLSLISNAGEILLGEHIPFSVANYAAGPNAVLPTGGTAKTYSPVSVRDFQKASSIVYSTPTGYETVKDHVVRLAQYEGFSAHANALIHRNKGETD
jgi:histidinol dehydrogenase